MAFRSVFIDGKISNPKTGKVAHLNLFGDDSLPYLESVSISLELGANMNLSMVFAPPYEKAIELISKDSEWFRVGNTLGLRWGYADVEGAISDWYYGLMMMPEVSFGDEISITVPAVMMAWNADRVARIKDWCADSPKSFKQVAIEIAQRYKLEADFSDIESNGSPSVQYFLDNPRKSLVQGNRTDLQFLLEESEKGAIRMVSRNNYLYFVDAEAPMPGYPDVNAVFQMYGKIDIWNNIFPMTSFNPTSMGLMFMRTMQGIVVYPRGPNDDPEVDTEPIVVDEKTKNKKNFSSPETIAGPPEKDGNPSQGTEKVKVKSVIAVDHSAGEGGRMFTLPMDDVDKDFIDANLSGALLATAEDHGISASFSCFAIPNLLPGMFVKLQGVGDYFSTIYKLQKVDITVDSGGAEMTCEGFSTGFPGTNKDVDPFASAPLPSTDVAENNWFDKMTTNVEIPVGE